jgi:hypothetical protein
VPHSLLTLRVPDACKSCRATGTVTAETTVTGHTVSLKWCCRKCGYDWVIVRGDSNAFIERRQTGERRKITRNERRKP